MASEAEFRHPARKNLLLNLEKNQVPWHPLVGCLFDPVGMLLGFKIIIGADGCEPEASSHHPMPLGMVAVAAGCQACPWHTVFVWNLQMRCRSYSSGRQWYGDDSPHLGCNVHL